ncbi:MAG: protein TolQ [Candidatus Thioglobus sp.]|nr:MAG: protein TolQ [Candidatus Thioglobus sp.]
MDSNISIFDLIITAGFVVQFVMLVLLAMSIYSWTIILSKKKILMDAKTDIKKFLRNFAEEKSLIELKSRAPIKGAMADIFACGYSEFTHKQSGSNQENSERAYRLMNTKANEKIDSLEKGLGALAMIASSSPYIGLFGTVWGIMHSFIGLASVKQASIAVVAPGIAEALIATAFGLFAAIPATIAFNRLSTQIAQIYSKYNSFVEKIFVITQRQQ